MPVCKGCSASYDDSFTFCPYCGTVKPEPTRVEIEISTQYEEAILRINLVKKETITEYPFNWQPNILEKILGDTGRNWTEVCFYNFLLTSTHPTKEEYAAYTSDPFRIFYSQAVRDELEFPIPVKNMLLHQPRGKEWIDRFFVERKKVWEDYNTYLIKNGWRGLTECSVKRTPPFEIEFDWSMGESALYMDGYLTIGKFSSVDKLVQNYRYNRPAS